jgi:hypothetical protein
MGYAPCAGSDHKILKDLGRLGTVEVCPKGKKPRAARIVVPDPGASGKRLKRHPRRLEGPSRGFCKRDLTEQASRMHLQQPVTPIKAGSLACMGKTDSHRLEP